MRTKIATLFVLFIAAPLLKATESEISRLYVEPSFSYLFMEGGPKLNSSLGYPYGDHALKNTPAYGLSAGFNLTTNQALELQASYFKAKIKAASYYSPSSFYGDPKGEIRGIPLMIGYKYRYNINNHWNLLIGTSAGITFYKTDLTETFLGNTVPGYASFPPAVYKNSYKSTAFVLEGSLGLEYNLNNRSGLSFGIKNTYFGSSTYTTQGVAISANMGYRFRF